MLLVVALAATSLHSLPLVAPRAAATQARAVAVPRLQLGTFDTPLPPELEADAQALLDENDGDVEKARTSYIGYTLAYLEEAMPDLYRQIKLDPNLPEAHSALVEVTWDAIAAFMPLTHSSSPTPAAAQRLTAIARSSLPDAEDMSVLDVGCGNGVLLPFLTACGLPADRYRGIDLSSRMIELAKGAHADSGATFEDVSFEDECDKAAAEGRTYDCIIFNGSLQFFEDQPATLAAAQRLLASSPSARIVVSHISGANFVRRELGDNPTTVSNTMPLLEMMQTLAGRMGMRIVLPSFFGAEPDEIEKALEAFYLVLLVDGADEDASKLDALDLPEDVRVDLLR